jgi:hypothetical protein
MGARCRFQWREPCEDVLQHGKGHCDQLHRSLRIVSHRLADALSQPAYWEENCQIAVSPGGQMLCSSLPMTSAPDIRRAVLGLGLPPLFPIGAAAHERI